MVAFVTPYRHAHAQFHLDAEGKMSKSLGNVVPTEVSKFGADTLRAYVLSSGAWEDLKFNKKR